VATAYPAAKSDKAGGAELKSCTIRFQQFDSEKMVDMTLRVLQGNAGLEGEITQTLNGTTTVSHDKAKIYEAKVREGLSPATDPYNDTLNQAELVVAHAMALTSDPQLGGMFSAGLDLSKVRSAKVYQIGPDTPLGATVIFEARDASGETLGSLMDALIVSPCR
jgi:hypothetical protein